MPAKGVPSCRQEADVVRRSRACPTLCALPPERHALGKSLIRCQCVTPFVEAHALAVIKNVSDRVAVMYLGRLCEAAPCELLFRAPAHPYSAALLSAIPVPDPTQPPRKLQLTAGDLPSPMDPPSGCRFRTRCPHAQARCAAETPALIELTLGHYVACHFPRAA